MRLVPLECIIENSLLGKDIYDSDGRILLRAGVKLTGIRIKRIKELKN